MSNTIKINGVTIEGDFAGRSVVVRNGEVIIDGKSIDLPDAKTITVEVVGDVDEIKTGSANVHVSGHVGEVQTASGNVVVTDSVMGDVQTASGSVKANAIGGSVRTVSGSISQNIGNF